MNAHDDSMRPDLPSPSGREDDDPDYRRYARREYDPRRQRTQDEEHLRVLSILYYVLGGLGLLGGFFPLIYVVVGVVKVSGAMNGPGPNSGPPAFFGWALILIPGAITLLAWALAACKLHAGYCLSQKKSYTYCFVVACIACIQVPLGTVLGVFTIVVLSRPGVKEMFQRAPMGPAPAPEE